MAAAAAIRAAYGSLGFTNAAATAITDQQDIDFVEELELLSDEETESLCKAIRRPGVLWQIQMLEIQVHLPRSQIQEIMCLSELRQIWSLLVISKAQDKSFKAQDSSFNYSTKG